jgi:hypothetical protein
VPTTPLIDPQHIKRLPKDSQAKFLNLLAEVQTLKAILTLSPEEEPVETKDEISES